MSIVNYIEQGGPIMIVLLILNVIGIATMITKFITLCFEKRNIHQTAVHISSKIKERLSPGVDKSLLIELTKQEVSVYIDKLEKGLSSVKIIASTAPLLGLLGTVVGILMAFQVMAVSGLHNPAAFAEGIALALITTVGGLIVSIPHYVGHSYLVRLLDNLELNIEKETITKIA